MSEPQHFRVFLASPGDVADERALARRLLKEELPYDRLLPVDSVTFRVVSWDDPAARTPMPARLTPQEAVIRFETKPSDCDVVVVVLWSRLGTHLDLIKFQKPNGDPYLSGTEWEYEDACKGKPEIFIYRRTEVPDVKLNDSAYEEKRRQYQLVGQFCESISQNPDGSFRGNVTDYDTPTAFEERLATDLKGFLRERLGKRNTTLGATAVPVWTDSPYPGLRPFTTKEAAIFFGRGREVDALIAWLRDPAQRFLAVVGASGTGKSSLVYAGLLPRLAEGAIEGSATWRVIPFKPADQGDNPFLALASALKPLLPPSMSRKPIEIAMALAEVPQRISEYAALPTGGAVMLFVDQLEELFTHAAETYREPFGALLAHAVAQPHLRVVTTLRADFLPQGAAILDLAQLLQAGTFVLAPPGPGALADMIRKPAERAGLELQDGLVEEILKDAGADPGVLPLMAFCLEKLYQRNAGEHRLTLQQYINLGGFKGALNNYSNNVYNYYDYDSNDCPESEREQKQKDWIRLIFLSMLRTTEEGRDTRQRRRKGDIIYKILPSSKEVASEWTTLDHLFEELVTARLLVLDKGGWVDLPHESLIEGWEKLDEWRRKSRDARRIVELFESNFKQWKENKKTSIYLLEGPLREAVRGRQQDVKNFVGASSEMWEFCERSFGVYSSTTKINYKPLATDLEEKNWKAAHEKTVILMIRAAKRETQNYLESFDLEILPPEDLRIIDQLWRHYSGGKFGFSVQKEIYQNLGGTTENYDEEIWTKFCDQIGWRQDGLWLYHSDLTFDFAAPQGHLPAAARLVWHNGWWCALSCHSLFGQDLIGHSDDFSH